MLDSAATVERPSVVLAALAAATGLWAAGCRKPPARDLLRAPEAAGGTARGGASAPAAALPSIRVGLVRRAVLPAGPPSRQSFRVTVPEGARLSFTCAIEHPSRRRGGVEFSVALRESDREQRLWARRVEPRVRDQDAGFVPGDVDLGAWAGRSVTLVLETRALEPAAAGDPWPAFGAGWGTPTLTSSRPAPLIVVYLVDTLRADHTGPYGYARPTTPCLDAFAREAALFEQAIASSSWTKASVASVLTALPPWRHGAMLRTDVLAEENLTLPELLQEAGWSTGAVVANPAVYQPGSGFEQGFDYFAGLRGGKEQASWASVRAATVVDAALSWIESRRGLPSFVYVHAVDPHCPYQAPPPFDRVFGGPAGGVEVVAGDSPETRQRAVDAYDGEIAYGDREFGRFLDELKRRGLYQQASIVFLADHGEEFLDHGGWSHGTTLLEELVHVPLLVKFRDGHGAHRRFAGQVQLVDVARTVMEEAGLPSPATLGGDSLRRVVDGEKAGARPAVLEIGHMGVVAFGCRTGTEKYIRRFRPQDDTVRFDLARDPGEHAPLALPEGERGRGLDELMRVAMRPNSFRDAVRFQGAGRYQVELRTSGSLEEVEGDLGRGNSATLEREGRLLRVLLQLPPGQTRDLRFRLRPRGAPVRLEGTWNGRPLTTREVAGTVSMAADPALLLPDPEAEGKPSRWPSFYARPRQPRAAIAVWLEDTDGARKATLDTDAVEALRALGYAGP